MNIVVGTAGHIDHGKTALVKALTGTDTDRLPEEKRRGITIDLGFAELQEDDVHLGFVDVPGHERFVKNMLAGASGIDLVLLVVAADEGVMPQTREHFDICRLLRIKQGIVALTKIDLVDDETLELARLEVADLVKDSFMRSAPVFAVSARTGAGIRELTDGLIGLARSAAARKDELTVRLPIDRSFTMRGFGAVVTGTLASGTIRENDELELLPGGHKVRVRGIQTHGEPVRQVLAGQRTAVNLGGIDYEAIHRGMLLSKPRLLHPEQLYDAEVEMLPNAARSVRSRQRLRVNIGTAEVLARIAVVDESQEIAPGSKGFAQLRLESPVAAVAGERFILRTYSPQVTVGGGSILRPSSEKLRRRNTSEYGRFLREFADSIDDPDKLLRSIIDSTGEKGISSAEIRAVTGWKLEVTGRVIQKAVQQGSIVDAGGVYLARAALDSLNSQVLAAVERHHKTDPLSRGLPLEKLRETIFRFVRPEIQKASATALEKAAKIAIDRDVVKLRSHAAQLSPNEEKVLDRLRTIYKTARLEVPKLDEVLSEVSTQSKLDRAAVRKIFQLLLNSGEIVKVSEDFYFRAEEVADLIGKLRAFADRSGDRMIDVPAFKDLAGISRKYAIPLLEFFDREKLTARRGDKRMVL